MQLIVPPFTFRRKFTSKYDGSVSFCCTGCEADRKMTMAHAIKTTISDNEMDDEYEMVGCPDPEDHICAPAGTEMLKKACI